MSPFQSEPRRREISARGVRGATTSTLSHGDGVTSASTRFESCWSAVVTALVICSERMLSTASDSSPRPSHATSTKPAMSSASNPPTANRALAMPRDYGPTIPGPVAAPYRSLPKNVSFPELEETVLARWRERDVFRESLRRREGAPGWVFYEGPPTANGRPGDHHVLARVFKDIFPRFKTMRGFYSYRKGGWDCHGLPVEIAVQEKLGFESKQQIEEYGIAEFNARCRDLGLEFLEDR